VNRNHSVLYLMLLPGIVLVILFNYLPMAGLVLAFQNFKPWLGVSGSDWVGLEHFEALLTREDSLQVIWNTFVIAGLKMIVGLIIPVAFAILLNEIRHMSVKRTVQTLVYLPHFMSWVILGGILLDLLSSRGLFNSVILPMFNLEPIRFLTDGDWFRFIVIASDTWKEFGFSTIVFLAALSGVNPSLYEAAEVDGATRFQQTWFVTLPAMIPIIVVVGTLSLGNILNAGFDQIFNLYNVLVYDKGDIIDTFVYRVGILSSQFGFATAVGLFKSVIGFVLIVLAYRLAYRYANYRIF
jgi:putative aldouronate transport system permease protein